MAKKKGTKDEEVKMPKLTERDQQKTTRNLLIKAHTRRLGEYEAEWGNGVQKIAHEAIQEAVGRLADLKGIPLWTIRYALRDVEWDISELRESKLWTHSV